MYVNEGGLQMLSQEQREHFIELRAAGLSFDKIAAELGVSKTTLLKLNKELAGEIERLKFINFEALAEKYKMLKTARIEALGDLLKRVDSALEAADFSKLSPERLVLLKLKLSENLRAELSESFSIEKSVLNSLIENERDYTLKVE